MSTILTAESYLTECRQVVESVFATMLGLSVEATPQEAPVTAGILTAVVYFSGAWRGALLLECSEPGACIIAGRLMSIPAPMCVDDDVRDSLAELANMVGGNLRAVLPNCGVLSTPFVIDGAQRSFLLAANVIDREALVFHGHPLWVTLLKLPD